MSEVKGRIAILKDDIPVVGVASSPEVLAETFKKSNYSVTFVSCEEISDESILCKEKFDVLVLPYGASFPASAIDTFRKFLKQGGHFISMGGYPFDNLLFKINGQWKNENEFSKINNQVKNPLFEVDTDMDGVPDFWKPDDKDHCFIENMPGVKGKCIKVTVSREERIQDVGWSSQETNLKDLKLKNKKSVTLTGLMKTENVTGHAGISFMYPGTAYIRIDQYDENGKLIWPGFEEILHINGTNGWRRYKTTFVFNERTVKFVVRCGLWAAWGTVWFTDIRIYEDIRVNTRHGIVRDGMWVEPNQIGVCDPSYTLENVSYAQANENQYIIDKDIKIEGKLQGYAAAAWLGWETGLGRGWLTQRDVRARWTPLINAYDKYGRLRGAIGAVLHNFAGEYKGSIWAYFGVTNKDLFGANEKKMLKALVDIADHMMRGLFLYNLATDYACYRQGETVNLAVKVGNITSEEKYVSFRIQIFEELGKKPVFEEIVSLKCPTREACFSRSQPRWSSFPPDDECRAEWKLGKFDKDFYYVKAQLEVDGKIIDNLDTGFVVWNTEVLKNGVQLDFADNYFHFSGKTAFLCGTKTGSFYLSEISSEEPLRWDCRFQKLQDNRIDTYGIVGLRPYFTDLKNPDERTLRRLDAIVQLCQKHKVIPLIDLQVHPSWYMDWSFDNELARTIGERYKPASAVLYHISGDIQTKLQNTPAMKREFNKFLKERYGDDEKLAEAWGDEAPKAKLGDIDAEEIVTSPWVQPSISWSSTKVYDINSFRNYWYVLWQRGCVDALRSGAAPNHYITAEFWLHLDQLNDSDDLDFATQNAGLGDKNFNKFYYHSLLKFAEMRAQRKSVVIGEYGSQVHPTFNGRGYSNESIEDQITRFLYVNYYTFGLGGSGVANWDWENKEYYIFPWGLVNLCDFTDRKTLKVYRNISIFLKLFDVKYEAPEVCFLIADSHRRGGVMREIQSSLLNSIDMLIGTHADFLVLNEFKIERLPNNIKILFWPIPWCPKDETVEKVKEFVMNGGILYVSGDISYNEDRKRTRLERLKELLGVELLGDNYPNIEWQKGKPVKIDPVEPFYGLESRVGRPCIKIKPTTAKVIAKDEEGNPVFLLNKLGKGVVFYNVDPLELYTVAEDREKLREGTNIYKALLRYAKAKVNNISPDDNLIRIFKLPTTRDETLYVLFNADTRAREITIQDTRKPITLTLGSFRPGVILLSKDQKILAVEAQGKVAVGDKTLIDVDGHFAIAALDKKDISESKNMLIFPQSKGRITITSESDWVNAWAELGDIIDSKWTKLEKLECSKKGNNISLKIDREQATNIILLGEGTVTPLVERIENFINELEPLC